VIRAIDGPIILTPVSPRTENAINRKMHRREPLRKVHEGILQLLNTTTHLGHL